MADTTPCPLDFFYLLCHTLRDLNKEPDSDKNVHCTGIPS